MMQKMTYVNLLSVFLGVTLALAQAIPPPNQNCDCFLFLKNELFLPRYLVMSLTNSYRVNCTNFGEASDKCKSYCSDELAALNSMYNVDPKILEDYPPAQDIPCSPVPTETVSFSRACGSQSYALSTRASGPPVCCSSETYKPIWCGTSDVGQEPFTDIDNTIQARKLDLTKDHDDESLNEIEDSSSTSSDSVVSPGKTKPDNYNKSGTKSWMKNALKFFGYDSMTDMIKRVDIFTLPGRVKAAIRTYKDEVSMGRCYMEFTTFKVFTKQENPFENFLRKKRDVDDMGPITRFDANFDDYESDDVRSISAEKQHPSQGHTVAKLVNGVAGFLERSESTKQYADMISSFLPLITQIASGGGGPSAAPSPLSMILKLAGPIISQMGNSRPSPGGAYQKPSRNPVQQSQPVSNTGAPSPLTSMLMNMAGNAIANFFSSPAAHNRIETPPPATVPPTQPAAPARPSLNLASSGINALLNMFLRGATRPKPVAQPTERPQPVAAPVTQQIEEPAEDKQEKQFIDMLLELVRPVFISIIGNAPGENGVKAIRRVSGLSTQSRVDDTLREEVDSPFFCFKKYMVNKAWSLTENGIREIVDTFTPEERARMIERMS